MSCGFNQRKITGATAATPAIARVFGSVTPAMYRASAAAMNDRAHEAAKALALSIFLFSPLSVLLPILAFLLLGIRPDMGQTLEFQTQQSQSRSFEPLP